MLCRASQVALVVKNLSANAAHLRDEGWEEILEKETATPCSFLAWEIPWSLAGYSPWGCKEWNLTEVTKQRCTTITTLSILEHIHHCKPPPQKKTTCCPLEFTFHTLLFPDASN